MTYLYCKIKSRVHFLFQIFVFKIIIYYHCLKIQLMCIHEFLLDMEMSLRITPGASLTKFLIIRVLGPHFYFIEILNFFIPL